MAHAGRGVWRLPRPAVRPRAGRSAAPCLSFHICNAGLVTPTSHAAHDHKHAHTCKRPAPRLAGCDSLMEQDPPAPHSASGPPAALPSGLPSLDPRPGPNPLRVPRSRPGLALRSAFTDGCHCHQTL